MKRETDRHGTSFFQSPLELPAPWRVVELKDEKRSVEIYEKVIHILIQCLNSSRRSAGSGHGAQIAVSISRVALA